MLQNRSGSVTICSQRSCEIIAFVFCFRKKITQPLFAAERIIRIFTFRFFLGNVISILFHVELVERSPVRKMIFLRFIPSAKMSIHCDQIQFRKFSFVFF